MGPRQVFNTTTDSSKLTIAIPTICRMVLDTVVVSFRAPALLVGLMGWIFGFWDGWFDNLGCCRFGVCIDELELKNGS